MFFNYLNIILEVTAHVFRAFGTCIILLPLAYFSGAFAVDMANGLSVIPGFFSAASVVLAVAATYMELEQAVEEVQAFRYWRAAIQNM